MPFKTNAIGRLGANGQLAGMAWIYTPFSTPDLLNWRSTESPYKEDPLRMESLFASIFTSHNSDWLDLQQMPNALLTAKELWKGLERARRGAGDLRNENLQDSIRAEASVARNVNNWDLPKLEQ